MKYGINYQGSKNRIVRDMCALFPKRENFYDLFAGGCAVTHRMLELGHFGHYYFSDINPMPVNLFYDCISGHKPEPRWVSHEEFSRVKYTDAYAACCFSFGGDWNTYAYSKEVEPIKEALHYAVVYRDFERSDMLGIDLHLLEGYETYMERYRALKKALNMNRTEECCNIERLSNLERLTNFCGVESLTRNNALERLTNLCGVESRSVSYDQVEIKPNSVVYCFDKETEVLTHEGWKYLKDITPDDTFLSREPGTGVLEYVPATRYISYHYTGKMYRYKGKEVDLCVTPDHKMYCYEAYGRERIKQEKFLTASELYDDKHNLWFISAGGKWEGEPLENITIGSHTFDAKDFAYLLGIFLTDGSVNVQGGVTINQTKKNIIPKIREVLNRLGIDYTEYKIARGTQRQFYIKREVGYWFDQFYLKENRRIPRQFLDANKDVLLRLLDGIIDGDSDKERSKIFMGAKGLIDDITELLYKVGKSAGIKIVHPGRRTLFKKENRYIETRKPYYIASVKNKLWIQRVKSNQSWVDYDDMVYCVTLSKWHTVLVRRNGKSIWCGQCDPPYANTSKYVSGRFDYDKFYDWCRHQTELTFISEYNMPDDFICIHEFTRSDSKAAKCTKKVVERLFIPKHQIDIYNDSKTTLF